MKIELLASWTSVPAGRPFRGWLRVARGSVGLHLEDGTFVVRRVEAGAPIAASLALPEGAIVALDPRSEVVAYVAGSRVSLVNLAGASLGQAELAPEVVVRHVELRADGERLWVFGSAGSTLRAYVFDRRLALQGEHRLELDHDPAPFSVHLHPAVDGFTLLANEDNRDPEIPMRFMGVVVEAGQPRVVFSKDDLDFPCVGFTRDGRFLVGVDAFNGVTLFRWPDFAYDAAAAHPEGYEGRFDAMILDGHVVTERHAEDTTESSLLVLSLPTLEEEAQIAWSERGAFAKPDDDFGLDMAAAVGSDAFLEVTNDEADPSAWTCRIWRLAAGD